MSADLQARYVCFGPTQIPETTEYRAIVEFYGDRCATRSRVPLINHINEGLEILSSMGAAEHAQRAWCLHPIFQADEALAANHQRAKEFDSYVMMLVMEYRRAANAYLCRPATDSWSVDYATLMVGALLPEVRHMLIADKRQNQRDFLLHHVGAHSRSNELRKYFENWLEMLG